MKHLFNLIGSPATIIDAGANTGMTTARFAIQYPQAKIIAIEPEPENFKLLKENTRSLPNVTCICGALWYKSTRIQIFDPKKSNYSFQVGAEASETDPHAVQTYTVDELIDMFGTGSVDFLKIDIEGAERDIFERPVDAWLKQIGIISIELHEKIKPGCSYHLMKQAVSRRFTMRGIGEKVILKFDDTPEVH
jgi:FkbM family methyltransferase